MPLNFRTLDLNLLRVFDVVMEEHHVTRAAERLAMTQPAVSNALRRLRAALDEDLFVPGPAGVTPTRHACELWPAVRSALRTMRAAIDPVAFDAQCDEREFTIAMADATAAVFMPVVMEAWLHAGTRSTLRVVDLRSRDPRPQLERGEIDGALGFFPDVARELASSDQLGTARLDALYDCDYVVVMRRGHALAAVKELDLASYCAAEHVRVDFADRPRGYVDEALWQLGRTRRVALTVTQFSTAGRVVSQSDMVTVMPRSYVPATGFADELHCRPLPLQLPRINVGLLWHRRHEHAASHVMLRTALVVAAGRVGESLRIGWGGVQEGCGRAGKA
jgi:DNA-binding transcriptional LysR family regulator